MRKKKMRERYKKIQEQYIMIQMYKEAFKAPATNLEARRDSSVLLTSPFFIIAALQSEN
jgi:hypothetical protein